MFRPPALVQPKNASAYTPPGKETDMQTPLHFILQFDMKSPYNKAYRSAAEALSCSLSAGEAAGKTPCTTIVLCDTDEAIQRHQMAGLPVIAVSHDGNSSEELMGTPWLILSPEALTRDFLYKVYCRHYKRPMWILETERCWLRELSAEDCDALLFLQEENAQNPEGCFFPAGCDNPEDFLMNYIRHQYPFFDFGLYAVLEKETGNFMGIAGFTGITEIASDGRHMAMTVQDTSDGSSSAAIQATSNYSPSAAANTTSDGISLSTEVSYALLQKYQHRGFAKEVLFALLAHGRKTGEFRQFTARIRPENTSSVALARKCSIRIYHI